jgi:4-amino-4-deoxy-L-arabinose transferase-like glycosyltransferase
MGIATHQIPLVSPDPVSLPAPAQPPARWPLSHIFLILGLWLVIFAAALFTPPLLDDADATHAQAAQAMLATGDWVTLHVDGIRYLEKPPLPYWITAISLRLFAPRAAAFAIHLPLALTILGLAFLGYAWSRRAFGQRTALYSAIFLLTSAGVFLFTRVFIPDALLSLFLAFALYALLRALAPPNPLSPSAQDPGAPFMRGFIAHGWGSQNLWPYALWLTLALAVLTKGLVTLVFFFGTAFLFLLWTNQLHHWRRLRPIPGILLFLAVAAPWHILAGLRNTGGANGHGFFWFYFINEHVLRFLGRRIPRDYNKLPAVLYWSLHLVWLFPWSLFAPAAIIYAWRNRSQLSSSTQINPSPRPEVRTQKNLSSRPERDGLIVMRSVETRSSSPQAPDFTHQTILILLIFSTLVLLFFSISTNQEYYTFPIYLPLLMLLAAAITAIQSDPPLDSRLSTLYSLSFAALTTIGLAIAIALAYGLWSSRHLPFVPDIGDLLAHRGVGDYTLSMSHFFDLTGPSFAALRLPATLALLAFLIGPPTAWVLHTRRRFLPAILTIAGTSTIFLIAAHIAFVRFNPMLSSVNFAETIQTLERSGSISPNTEVLIYGDQAFGSSIPFYLNRHVFLVDGRTTSMLFGSTFPDAPHLFLTSADLLAQWGTGPRKLLFVPLEQRDAVDRLLGPRQIVLQQTSGKALITDRPLDSP